MADRIVPRSRGKDVVTGLLVAASVLMALELAARIGSTAVADFRRFSAPEKISTFVPSERYGWKRRPGFRGIAAETHLREFDTGGYFTCDTAQVAGTTRPKIVFIGDSNTFGLDVPTEDGFVEVVDRLLPEVDAINLAVPAYSSFQGVLVAQDKIPLLKPAVVVVSFNFNDRRWVDRASKQDGAASFREIAAQSNRVLSRVRKALSYSHLYLGMRKLLRLVLPMGGAATGSRSVRMDQVVPRVPIEAYRENLREMGRIARENGARVAFVILRDSPDLSKNLRRAADLIHDGRDAEAVPLLEALVASHRWYDDEVRVKLATAYRDLGWIERADAVLKRPLPAGNQGNFTIVSDVEYNRVMREVALESGALCIEAADRLDTVPWAFIDSCHFNSTGHRMVGETIAESLRQILPVEAR